MFERLQKWFVIRSYARKLRTKLRERYGVAGKYSPNQVALTVDKYGFNKEWIRYAPCMFCDYPDLAKYDAAVVSDYAAIRSEMAKRFFGGNASFTAADFGRKPAPGPSVSNDGGTIPTEAMYGSGDLGGGGGGEG